MAPGSRLQRLLTLIGLLLALGGFALPTTGCMKRIRVVHSGWDSLRKLADQQHGRTVESSSAIHASDASPGEDPGQGALSPRHAANPSDLSPLNLRTHRGMYTLQIGFYDRRFQGDRRKAAVRAARQLRSQGAPAYYYHGKFRSMVTVGLFNRQQAFVMKKSRFSPGSMVQAYAPRVMALQKKFPYNLEDGLTMIEKRRGRKPRAQSSALVRIPG